MPFPHWILFIVGWVLHLLLQAKASANSRSNSLQNIWQWFRLQWLVVIARLFLAVLFMLLWHEAPSLFGQIVGAAIPMTMATSGIAGFAVDAFVDKIGAIFHVSIEIPALKPADQEKP